MYKVLSIWKLLVTRRTTHGGNYWIRREVIHLLFDFLFYFQERIISVESNSKIASPKMS